MRPISPNLVKIINILSDGEYHDGTSIGQKLNISRAAVSKAINKLSLYNISYQSIKGKGYKLESPLILLDSEVIQENLNSNLKSKSTDLKIDLDILEKITSTNDYLKAIIKNQIQNQNNNLNNIKACFAETQTAGRGRLNRSWYSPFGKNIYFSLSYPFEKDVSALGGLSLIIGLAVCKAIESKIDLDQNSLKLKWPNDILVNGAKLGGILIDVMAESNGFSKVIIGVGLNINIKEASQRDIPQNWTSVFKLIHKEVDRNQLGSALIYYLLNYLERFSQNGLDCFLSEWAERDYLLGSDISLQYGNKTINGQCLGIDVNGYLKIKTIEGKEKVFSSGDVVLLK